MNIKNMIAALLVVTAGLGANTASAWSIFANGNDLLGWCETSKDADLCAGYIMAISDQLEHEYEKVHDEACVPESATSGQLERVTVNWLEANPQYLHRGANLLVWNALMESFGCEIGLNYFLD